MKYKTKYDLGDVVFAYIDNKKQLCKVIGIYLYDIVDLSNSMLSYQVEEINPLEYMFTISKNWIKEEEILQKLNKKEFNKAYAKKCAEKLFDTIDI